MCDGLFTRGTRTMINDQRYVWKLIPEHVWECTFPSDKLSILIVCVKDPSRVRAGMDLHEWSSIDIDIDIDTCVNDPSRANAGMDRHEWSIIDDWWSVIGYLCMKEPSRLGPAFPHAWNFTCTHDGYDEHTILGTKHTSTWRYIKIC